jgi:hypothetical protein
LARTARVYSLPRRAYITLHVRCRAQLQSEEAIMRAEAEKLVDAIRQSLALLRRHL